MTQLFEVSPRLVLGPDGGNLQVGGSGVDADIQSLRWCPNLDGREILHVVALGNGDDIPGDTGSYSGSDSDRKIDTNEDIRFVRLWYSGFMAMARSMAAVGGTPYLAKA